MKRITQADLLKEAVLCGHMSSAQQDNIGRCQTCPHRPGVSAVQNAGSQRRPAGGTESILVIGNKGIVLRVGIRRGCNQQQMRIRTRTDTQQELVEKSFLFAQKEWSVDAGRRRPCTG